jgi:hypothetical protein
MTRVSGNATTWPIAWVKGCAEVNRNNSDLMLALGYSGFEILPL